MLRSIIYDLVLINLCQTDSLSLSIYIFFLQLLSTLYTTMITHLPVNLYCIDSSGQNSLLPESNLEFRVKSLG